MVKKGVERERWAIYMAFSLLFHVVLFLGLPGLSPTIREEPESLRSVRLQWTAWTPPEPSRSQETGGRHEENRPDEKEETSPSQASPRIRADKPPPLEALSTPARNRQAQPVSTARSLSIPVFPWSSGPVPPEVWSGGKVAVPRSREENRTSPIGLSVAARQMELRDLENQSLSPVPTPSVSAESALDQKESAETEIMGPAAADAGNVTLAAPRYRENESPTYPRLARLRGYEGTVSLEVEVRVDGRVGEVRIKESSHYRVLDEAAVKAVRKWLFSPAKRGEMSVVSRVVVPIRFQLVEK